MIERADGNRDWMSFDMMAKEKGQPWIEAMLKKQGWMTGCWVDCESKDCTAARSTNTRLRDDAEERAGQPPLSGDSLTTTMNTYTCTTFTGHQLIGSAAIIAAESKEIAADELNKALKDHGLEGGVKAKDMTEFNPSSGGSVRLLCPPSTMKPEASAAMIAARCLANLALAEKRLEIIAYELAATVGDVRREELERERKLLLDAIAGWRSTIAALNGLREIIKNDAEGIKKLGWGLTVDDLPGAKVPIAALSAILTAWLEELP